MPSRPVVMPYQGFTQHLTTTQEGSQSQDPKQWTPEIIIVP